MDNLEKKPDRRIAKTKRAICNALVELLSVKDINKITITDVADVADVNRKTVYNYYDDIYQILDEIENDLVVSYEKVIDKIDIKDSESAFKIFGALTEVLNGNLEFYSRLLKINTNSKLVQKIVASLKVRLKLAYVQKGVFEKDKVDLISSYVVSGMLAAYQLWFNSGREQSLEDFSKDVSKLVYKGIRAFGSL